MTNQKQTPRRGRRLFGRAQAIQMQEVRAGRRPSSNRRRDRVDQPFVFDSELYLTPPFTLPAAGPR
jgi:hypothetical protein